MNHRAILEKTYIASANIYISQKRKENGISRMEEVLSQSNIPCRIGYETVTGTDQGNLGVVYQQVVLFCSPEIRIPPNSKVEVTQHGVTEVYKHSGKPAIYSTHQEIILSHVEVA